ncbi:MAG: NAD(P)H-hydrate dehydratase [Oscillospiraceae bacterium]
MKRILSANQMRMAEEASDKLGVSLWQLMQKAGSELASAVLSAADKLGAKRVLILCGAGNNGGDGLVCAEHLATDEKDIDDLEIIVGMIDGSPRSELSLMAYSLMPGGVTIKHSPDFSDLSADIIVDCVYGTGFHGEFSDEIRRIFDAAENSKAYKIACDMPSGIDCRKGTAAKGTLHCDETVTFHAAKFGMCLKPAREHCGKVTVADIDIPERWVSHCDDDTYMTEIKADLLRTMMPKRPEYSHKGTFGKLLLICGSENYIGAAAICSRAALNTGCGMVNLAAPKSVITSIAIHTPECIYTALPSDENGCISEAAIPRLLELAKTHDAVVLGCGIGQTEDTAKIVEALIKNVEKPMLIDADGINQVAKNIDVLRDKCSEIILTPHIAEISRLFGCTVAETMLNRYNYCRDLTREYGVTLHCKDATSITCRDKRMYITNFGCSALAKGGSGDMLAGVAGSMLAQGKDPEDACMLADYIVGSTAEILCEDYSPAAITATDIINAFKTTLKQL